MKVRDVGTLSGRHRRTYVVWGRGSAAHLRERSTAAGPVTLCHKPGGTETNYPDAKDRELCTVCGRKAGVVE